jgi:hypothetical protein
MSDFLTRLAERQLGQIASVDARVPELYATSAAAAPQTIVEDVPAMVLGNRESIPAPAPTVNPTSRRNPPAALPNDGRVAAPPMKHAAQSPVMKTRETPLAPPPTSEKRVVPLPSLDQPIRPVASAPTAFLSQQSKPELHNSSSTISQAQTVQTLQSLESAATPIASTRVLPDAPLPRLEFKSSHHSQTGAPRREVDAFNRSVQVTIGCIEVTALSAAPAERRAPKPRKASMSLEDYLTRRQGRRRE